MLRRQRDLGKSEVIAARIEKIAQALTVGFRVRSHICDEAIYTGLGDGILCVPFCTVPDVGTPRDIQRGISLINRLVYLCNEAAALRLVWRGSYHHIVARIRKNERGAKLYQQGQNKQKHCSPSYVCRLMHIFIHLDLPLFLICFVDSSWYFLCFLRRRNVQTYHTFYTSCGVYFYIFPEIYLKTDLYAPILLSIFHKRQCTNRMKRWTKPICHNFPRETCKTEHRRT